MANRILHLGVMIQEKETNHINRELYLMSKPEGMNGWTEEHYAKQRIKAAINYDANMEYFRQIDIDEFGRCLEKMCKKHSFEECFDLKHLNGVSGLYILVLDEFKQVYIGKSNDIKKRIQQHWNDKKSLERLIYGDICSSILPIDAFGALDTTRVFYMKSGGFRMGLLEEKIVGDFDVRFTLNRTAGGIGSHATYTDDKMSSQLAIVANRKKRCLIEYMDMDAFRDFIKLSGDETKDFYFSRYPILQELL